MVAAAVMAAAAVLSCAKVDRYEPERSSRIVFDAVVARMLNTETKAGTVADTKAILEGSEYPKTIPFKVISFYDGGDGLRDGAGVWIPESVISYDDAWKIMDGDVETVYNWPLVGSLTFMAYSPEKVEKAALSGLAGGIKMDNDGIAITEWNCMKPTAASPNPLYGVDLMVADLLSGQKDNSSVGEAKGVPLVFHHMLTQVSFEVYKTETTETITLNSMTLVNVAQTASFKAGFGEGDKEIDTWTSLSETNYHSIAWTPITLGEIVLYTASVTSGDNLSPAAEKNPRMVEPRLFIPQDLTIDQRIVIEYTQGTGTNTKKFTRELRLDLGEGWDWERGKHIKYTITIDEQQKIRFDISHGTWTDIDMGGGGLVN